MAYDEGRVMKDGEVLPIECIRMRLKQPSNPNRMMHYHDYTELLFGLNGTAQVYIGNRTLQLQPETLVVIQSGDAHDVRFLNAPCEYIVVKFLPEMLISAEQTGAEFGYALSLMEQSQDRQSFFSADELDRTEIPSVLRRMMSEWGDKKFGYELSLRADVTRIILFLLRHWEEKSPLCDLSTQAGDRRLAQTALSYIRENYAEVCERDVADICGISPIGVSRLFARVLKCSFPDYVCSVRLREAEKLLLTTDMSVTDIAMQVGFSTSAYFIAKFREEKGTTPYKYRKIGVPH